MNLKDIIKKVLANNYYIAGVLFLLTSLFYSNLLLTGYLGDDAYNSQITGKLIQENSSLISMINRESIGWLNTGSIRFTFYYFIYPLFHYVTDIQNIKLISIFTLFLANFSFYLFISKLFRCNSIGLLATLFIFILIQYRSWHDPVLGFPSFQLPLISAVMFLSFYLFMQFLESNKKGLNLISLLLLLFCLCMYEATLPFIPVFGILAFTQNKNLVDSFRDVQYHIFIVSIYFITIAYLKLMVGNSAGYPGVSLKFSSITDLIMAFTKQIYATFPLSYSLSGWLSDNQDRNLPENLLNLLPATSLSWGVLLGLVVIFFYCFKLAKPSTDKRHRLAVLLILLNLLVVPALLISISGHQKAISNISWGLAYLPIFTQYFGLSLLITYGLIQLVSQQKNIIKKNMLLTILTIIYFFIAFITLHGNNKIVSNELPKRFSLDLIQQSFNDGFYDVIMPEDVLLRQQKYPQDWLWFYYQNLGFKIPLCELINDKTIFSDFVNSCIDTTKSEVKPENAWITAYSPDFINGTNGIVFLSKVNKVVLSSNSNPVAMYADNIRIYHQKSREIKVIESISIDFMKIINSEFLYTNFEDFKLDDVAGEISIKTTGMIHKPEGNIGNLTQWVSGDIEIEIYNNSKKSKRVEIQIEAFSPDTSSKKINLLQGIKIVKTIQFDNNAKIQKVGMILLPGINLIKIKTNDSSIENGDPRKIIYGLKNLKITEVKE